MQPAFKTFRDILPVTRVAAKVCFRSADFSRASQAFREVIEKRQRALHVVYHGGAASWLWSISAACEQIVELGGGERVPFGVFHDFFFQVPQLSRLPSLFCNTQRVRDFRHLVQILRSGPYTDVGLYPEGTNCLHGDGVTVMPFKSPRFIELALACDLTLVVSAFSGTQRHIRPVHVPPLMMPLVTHLPFFDSEKVRSTQRFPIPMVARIDTFHVAAQVYRPCLTLDALACDHVKRRAQLWTEAHQVRRCMQRLLDEVSAAQVQDERPSSDLEWLPFGVPDSFISKAS